jgi:hypothetical protein
VSRGQLALLLLLAGLPLLFLAPLGWGGVRLGGVGFAWWYGAVAAPLLAVLVTVLSLRR